MRNVLSSEEERRETYVRRSRLDVRFVAVPQLNPCDSTMLDEKWHVQRFPHKCRTLQSKILSTTLYIQLSIRGSVISTTLIVYKASVICHYVLTLVHTKQDFIHHSLHTVVHTRFSDTTTLIIYKASVYNKPLCTYSRTYKLRVIPTLYILSYIQGKCY